MWTSDQSSETMRCTFIGSQYTKAHRYSNVCQRLHSGTNWEPLEYDITQLMLSQFDVKDQYLHFLCDYKRGWNWTVPQRVPTATDSPT